MLLVLQLRANELTVQTSNVADRNVLRTFHLASTCVRTVTEAQLIHLCHHRFCTTSSLYATLGQESQLAHLGRNEQHSRTILTCSSTSTTTDASSRIHSQISILLGNRSRVGIRHTTCVDRHETTCLDDLVVSRTIDHQVTDHREASRTPRFDGNGLTIMETTHVELTSCSTCCGSVGVTIHIQRTHTADTFAAVVVKYDGLFAFVHQLFVQNIQHLQK